MKRAVVYPYDAEFSPILRHRLLLGNIEIAHLVSPLGWGFSNKDAGIADGGCELEFPVEIDFKNALQNSEVLLLVDSGQKLDFNRFVYPKIIKSAEQGKKIICARNLQRDECRKAIEFCDKIHVEFEYFDNIKIITDLDQPDVLFEMNTPVVFILGVAERANKFEIQLALREEFIKLNYKSSQIGSRKHCEILGFHSMPDFMTEVGLTENQKIIQFNHYVKNIEITENSDLIIIGIPGGIIPISDKFPNGFGILAFEIAQALTPDYVILSSLYEDYKEDYFDLISQGIQKKMGFFVDCHNISNKRIAWNDSLESGSLNYLTIDSDFIDRKIQTLNLNKGTAVNILREGTAKYIADNIVSQLSEYAYVKSV